MFILAEGSVPKYDIACIGAGMAGLATAALLTRAGKAVCLMDPADSAGGCVAAQEIEGFRFSAGPTISYGFEPGGILQKLCYDLDLSVGGTNAFPGYQVVMPGHRITVSGDPRETLEELIREFPDEIQSLTKLYRDVQRLSERSSKSSFSRYVLRLRNADAYLQSYGFRTNLRAYFDVQSRFFFGCSLKQIPLASLVLMLTTAPHYLPEGFTLLADQLLSIIQQQNGTWYHTEPYPELMFRNNRITGVRTSQGIIEPHTVILNAPDERAESILFIGIRDEVIPVGMRPTVLCLAEDELSSDYYALSLSQSGARMAAPVGMSSLTAEYPPSPGREPTADSFMPAIASVVPFLKDFQVISAMQDPRERRFPLPSAVTVQSSEYGFGRPMIAPCSVKNLKIVRDSVRALLPAVFTARSLAEKLT